MGGFSNLPLRRWYWLNRVNPPMTIAIAIFIGEEPLKNLNPPKECIEALSLG